MKETLPSLFFRRVEKRPSSVALRHKQFGIWQEISWKEYRRHVEEAAFGLMALGCEPGDRVGLIGDNRPEWLFSDLGIMAAGGITVGIYTTSSPEQCEYILGHSEARFFIVEGEEQLDKALLIHERLPNLKKIIVMDMKGLRGFSHPLVMSLEELMAQGTDMRGRTPGPPDLLEKRVEGIDPEKMAVLIYTSGTTGPPKGVMLSHRNILSAARSLILANPVYEHDEALSYLPLSHIAERMLSVFQPILRGHTVNFVESPDTMFQNLSEVSPTVFFGVPRVWEKIYSTITLKMEDSTYLKRLAYSLALEVGRAYSSKRLNGGPVPFLLRLLYWTAYLSVFYPLKRLLGLERARLVISGAAPISPDVLGFFHSIGVPIREVYGQTEGSGPTTIHQESIRLGTVGRPIPGVEVRIAGDGEILVRGDNVFLGYYRDPEATSGALRDGWLHSGDVGEMDPGGFLRITDRKKDIFITSAGKNITPQFIENKLKFSPYISDAVVVGDGRKYLTVLLVIDEENVRKYAQDNRIPFTTFADLSTNKEVGGLIEKEVAEVNKSLSGPEQIKKFRIIPKRLYMEDGEVTPTLKVKRKAIAQKYRDMIEEMYHE